MALCLYYILTTHHEVDYQFDAQTQQNLMGYALKTFHDFPVITDQTEIAELPVLDAGLRGNGNSIQVILRPISPEEAITFWSSEDNRTARLSAYYEVRVVMLEPEPPRTMPGLVLNLGSYLVQLGSPHLERSQSLVSFQLPARNGGAAQQVEAAPARVTLNNTLEPLERPEAHNRFQLLGTNLTAGRSRSLILKNSIWSNPSSPNDPDSLDDPPIEAVEQVIVDLEQNPDWNVEFSPERIEIEMTPTLIYFALDGATVELPILPGFYSISIRSVLNEQIINSELKQITVTSNEIGFTVAPRIMLEPDSENNIQIDALGNIQINLGSEFNPLSQNLPEDSIQVIVAGEVYTRTETEPPANEREFFITNTSPNQLLINPHFPVSVSEPTAYPFRLIVNGAESAPFWLELNPEE